jgi:transposase
MTDFAQIKPLTQPGPEREGFLQRTRERLPAEDFERIRFLLEWVETLLALLAQKKLSIARLRQTLFGSSTERRGSKKDPTPKPPKKGKGHGRCAHTQYTGARRRRISHPTLQPGDPCPRGCGGKVRKLKRVATHVHVKAEPPVQAEVIELEQLRCDGCGEVFTAPMPPNSPPGKYDASVGVLVGLMRFGCGMPYYRLAKLQASLGVPLPAANQCEQAGEVAEALRPVWEQLIYLGAQQSLLYSDDTSMRVQSLRRAIQAEASEKDPKRRTGIFTTGIVCQGEPHSIHLFFTGRNHAGENLDRLLERRAKDLGPPQHMCDGLDRNRPKTRAVVPCGCGAHNRRNFVELEADHPEPCARVLDCIGAVYALEAEVKAKGLAPEERLRLHVQRSEPAMEALREYCQGLIESKEVEPNSGLGQAIGYMTKRWEEITQFYRIAGAPLDNNISERLLKTSIQHRKNSLHYKTERGAEVGDIFMGVIRTCVANDGNPFDYMLAVVRHAKAAKESPEAWLPWNYKEALAAADRPKEPPP